MSKLRKAEDIIAHFDSWDLVSTARSYLQTQSRRYEFLLREIDQLIAKIQRGSNADAIRILDIGPYFQTEILRRTLPEAIVNTLGFEDANFKRRSQDNHFHLGVFHLS